MSIIFGLMERFLHRPFVEHDDEFHLKTWSTLEVVKNVPYDKLFDHAVKLSTTLETLLKMWIILTRKGVLPTSPETCRFLHNA